MNKFMLITVVEREIFTEQFGSYQEAICTMMDEMCHAGMPDAAVKFDEYDDGDCGFGKYEGYITDGTNHQNYDWRIIAL